MSPTNDVEPKGIALELNRVIPVPDKLDLAEEGSLMGNNRSTKTWAHPANEAKSAISISK